MDARPSRLERFRQIDLSGTDWERVEDGSSLLQELRREVGRRHVLYGREAQVIARGISSDDVLILLDADDHYLAGVHLTWNRHPEPDPRWPATWFYRDLDDFIARDCSPRAQ